MTRKQAEQYGRLMAALTGLGFTYDEANQLRRIEMTLHRWAEYECGDSNDRFSRAIERDETTGKPFWCVYWHDENKVRRTPCADREKGALKRLKTILYARNQRRADGTLLPYHQGDPRGCALYLVHSTDIPNGASIDSYYTRGIAIAA